MPERQGSREGLCSQDRGVRGGGEPGGSRSSQSSGLGEGQVCRESLACFQEERRGGRSERTEVLPLPSFPTTADTETAGRFFNPVFITGKALLIKS